MVRSATLTTVPSSRVSPDPRTAAVTIARPVVLPYATWPLVESWVASDRASPGPPRAVRRDYRLPMALLHDATITPGKRDLIKGWLPSRAWFDGDLDGRKPVALVPLRRSGRRGRRRVLPDGAAETRRLLGLHAAGPDELPRRAAGGAEEHLIGDDRALGARARGGSTTAAATRSPSPRSSSAILTGGHEAELTIEQDGRMVTLDPTCRVSGSGTATDGVRVDTVSVLDAGRPDRDPGRRPHAGARPRRRHRGRRRAHPHRPVGRPRSRRGGGDGPLDPEPGAERLAVSSRAPRARSRRPGRAGPWHPAPPRHQAVERARRSAYVVAR